MWLPSKYLKEGLLFGRNEQRCNGYTATEPVRFCGLLLLCRKKGLKGIMAPSHSVFLLLGVALCAVVLIQLGLWAAQSLSILAHNRRQFDLSRKLMLQQIDSIIEQRVVLSESVADGVVDSAHKQKNSVSLDGSWSGYRSFTVARAAKETQSVTSLYLVPEDGKPIAHFRPGQHLTLKLLVPGKAKPVVRCYSLSSGMVSDPANGVDGPCYRISVRALVAQTPATATAPASVHYGTASTFINQSVSVGQRIEVKSPAGQFWLDEESPVPVVLLAGGIGITPMISMLERMKAAGSRRSAVLFYGVRNSREHAFEKHLQSIAAAMPNVHVINCYSRPLPEDIAGEQFQVQGFVSIDLLRQVLPNNQYQFYMCGPPPFMESLYQGLLDWQVPEGRIHYEAFGPASIGTKKAEEKSALASDNAQVDSVSFVRSGKTALWSAGDSSLLDLAEANGIFPDSGCRAGSCGSCETGLVTGKVAYAEGHNPDCLPSKCLICIARPDGPVELDL